METWKRKFSENDCEMLEVLRDLRCESSSMEASASFVYGCFKLGAVIMLEVLTGKEELVRGGD